MLKFGNREFLNIQQQVGKNKSDIEDIKKTAVQFSMGIKVVGERATAEELPDPLTYDGDFGDAFAVGSETPFEYYVFTRPNTEIITPHWFNIGEFPLAGPQGEQGEQGAPGVDGEDGKDGSRIYVQARAPQLSDGKNTDMWIDSTNDNLYLKTADVWGLVGNIKGSQGLQGIQGLQGPRGESGAFYILGQVASIDDLPDPEQVEFYNGAYFVGASSPYDLYTIVGNAGSRQWFNYGQLAFDATQYVTLATDQTITGVKTFSKIVTLNTGATNGISFGNSRNIYSNGQYIAIKAGTSFIFENNYLRAQGKIVPYLDSGIHDLGAPYLRWKDLYLSGKLDLNNGWTILTSPTGLTIGYNDAAYLSIYTNGNQFFKNVMPASSNAYNLGSSTAVWSTTYTNNISDGTNSISVANIVETIKTSDFDVLNCTVHHGAVVKRGHVVNFMFDITANDSDCSIELPMGVAAMDLYLRAFDVSDDTSCLVNIIPGATSTTIEFTDCNVGHNYQITSSFICE